MIGNVSRFMAPWKHVCWDSPLIEYKGGRHKRRSETKPLSGPLVAVSENKNSEVLRVFTERVAVILPLLRCILPNIERRTGQQTLTDVPKGVTLGCLCPGGPKTGSLNRIYAQTLTLKARRDPSYMEQERTGDIGVLLRHHVGGVQGQPAES